MQLRELAPADMNPMTDVVRLFGSPAFMYAELADVARRWILALVRRQDSFLYANELREIWSYLTCRRQLHRRSAVHGAIREIMTFALAYWRKKRRRFRTA
jgi:hypothetical protein